MRFLAAVLLLSNFGLAQKVPDAQRYKMLNTYQKATAILNEINNTIKPQLCAADKACAAKADEFNKLAVQLQAEQAEAAKAMGLPEGTRFNISPATDEGNTCDSRAEETRDQKARKEMKRDWLDNLITALWVALFISVLAAFAKCETVDFSFKAAMAYQIAATTADGFTTANWDRSKCNVEVSSPWLYGRNPSTSHLETDYGHRNGWFRHAWLRSQEKERAHRSGEVVVDSDAGQWLGTPSGNNSQS